MAASTGRPPGRNSGGPTFQRGLAPGSRSIRGCATRASTLGAPAPPLEPLIEMNPGHLPGREGKSNDASLSVNPASVAQRLADAWVSTSELWASAAADHELKD